MPDVFPSARRSCVKGFASRGLVILFFQGVLCVRVAIGERLRFLGEDAQAESPRKTLRLTRSREKMDSALAGGFARNPGDAGGGGAIRPRKLRKRSRARGLTRGQSAMLAAVLPNPKGWDPTKPGRTLRWRQQRILQRERNAHFPEKLLR